MNHLLKFLIIAFITTSCIETNKSDKPDHYANQSRLGYILMGTHELRKINIKQDSNKWSSEYFIVYDTDKDINKIKILFNWKLGDEYVTSILSLSKIRVIIDESLIEPYIKFKWRANNQTSNLDHNMSTDVVYMVIYCNEEDYPIYVKK